MSVPGTAGECWLQGPQWETGLMRPPCVIRNVIWLWWLGRRDIVLYWCNLPFGCLGRQNGDDPLAKDTDQEQLLRKPRDEKETENGLLGMRSRIFSLEIQISYSWHSVSDIRVMSAWYCYRKEHSFLSIESLILDLALGSYFLILFHCLYNHWIIIRDEYLHAKLKENVHEKLLCVDL